MANFVATHVDGISRDTLKPKKIKGGGFTTGSEELEITVTLISNGDTSSITDHELCKEILKLLEKVEPEQTEQKKLDSLIEHINILRDEGYKIKNYTVDPHRREITPDAPGARTFMYSTGISIHLDLNK